MNSKITLLVSYVLAIVSSIIYYFYSPEKVAIHFGANGVADSWASKNTNLLLWIVLYSIMTGFFLLIPLILKKIPVELIKIPNKQYWLIPERMDHSFTLLSVSLYKIGTALNIFFIILGVIGFRANFIQGGRIDNTAIYVFLGVFLIYTVWWLMKFYRQFKIPNLK